MFVHRKDRGKTIQFTVAAMMSMVAITPFLAGRASAEEVNIYSYRKEQLIRPQLDAFTKVTGIKVNLVTGGADALIQRILREGMNSPADALLSSDAGRLVRSKEIGILQPVKSARLDAAIPARYRDPEGYWFGLGIRARAIIYAIDRVKPSSLSTYEALTGAQWKNRVLIRSSSNIYNQSLLASLIKHLGKDGATSWARGIVANMARRPQGGDTDQIRGVAAGAGDVAIANHYYYARLKASTKARDKAVVAKVRVFWPNQNGRGAHVNISGAGVTKSARHKAAAIRLLEFLASEQAQKIYAEKGFEFPVRRGVAVSPVVASLGTFKSDAIKIDILGKNNAAAVRIFDRAGWR
jgi:iron(III) transport system substrate-binding protein